MHFVYAVINFLLLAGIIFIIGRKPISAIFRSRKERLASELDRAEQPIALPETATGSSKEPPRLPARCAAELAAAKSAALEDERRIRSRFEHERNDLRRAMLRDVRDGYIEELKKLAAERMLSEPLRTELKKKDAEMMERVLKKVRLTPGDKSYLAKSDVLYVTLTSAYPLAESLIGRVGEYMTEFLKRTGDAPSYLVKVDESLLCGFQLRVGDTIYDCSAANRIYRLGKMLSKLPLGAPDGNDMLESMLSAIELGITDIDKYQVGRVISVSDGICWLDGLSDIVFGGVVEFECGERGMVLDIERDRIACVIFGRYEHIESYSRVRRLGVLASVPVGDELLGRVVDPLGRPIDGKGGIWSNTHRKIEFGAPAIPDRKAVSSPLHTGIKIIDSLVPIGRGQRELIIGDRQTGKTSIAIDTIINQKGRNIPCIYVAIGQKEATVADIVSKLEKYGAMEYTTIVCATASDSASLQYIAPFAGAAMCEHFMYSGRDTLVVYDDLSKHAVAYRELSLLLHRPSGREAYPGDIFYLHARLLERAAQLSDDLGGGSMTALPIIETQAGDISAYIPTNVISITDGQIFLETDLFNEGQRPAVNVGLSVSRVGSAAQTRLMKQVSSRLRMSLAQYRELVSFAQFGSDLDDSTRSVLDAGARMMAALRQGRYAPLPDWKQALLIYAVAEGFASNVQPDDMEGYENRLFSRFEAEHRALIDALATGDKLSADTAARLREALAAISEAI